MKEGKEGRKDRRQAGREERRKEKGGEKRKWKEREQSTSPDVFHFFFGNLGQHDPARFICVVEFNWGAGGEGEREREKFSRKKTETMCLSI